MIWIIFLIFVVALITATVIRAWEESEKAADRRFWNNLSKTIKEARNDFA